MNEPDSQNARSDSPTTGEVTWNVFISYSHKDIDVAERVDTALEREGVKVWRDKKEIVPGEDFVKEIGTGLSGSSTVVFLISPDSVSSNWFNDEYSTAVVLSNEPAKEVVIIPVLIKGARDDDIPALLRSKQRVDLRVESKFEDGIKELIQGIKREPITSLRPSPEFTPAEFHFLEQISFLGFFPEGLLPPAFDSLVVHLKVGDAVEKARKKGVVLDTEIDGIELIAATARMIKTLYDHISDKQARARETLKIIERWLADTNLFDSTHKRLGVGRSLLVRDLLILSGHLSDDLPEDSGLRGRVSALARQLLPQIIEENLRIAAEVSKSLMEAIGFTSADYLMHARLLLGLGLTEQALQIFESYGSDDLFAEAGLDPETRVFVIQDWAKAVKDSGRASRMHKQLVQAYEQLLVEVETMKIQDENSERLEELKADILNNRATQLAVYGDEGDWTEVQADIEEAAKTYSELGLNGKLLASRASFVALSLDRLKRLGEAYPKATLQRLQDSLNSLDKVAEASEPDNDLFLFFYQKARLVKRLYPNDQKRGINSYKLATDVAGPEREPKLPHRYPIAQRWVLKLSHQAFLISEANYGQGLRECAKLLRQHSEDAWAAHALYATLFDLTLILRATTGNDRRNSWSAAKDTFTVAARLFRRSGSGAARRRLVEILKLMSDLADDDLKVSFLQDEPTAQFLTQLVNAPKFGSLNWKDIHNWLIKQEE